MSLWVRGFLLILFCSFANANPPASFFHKDKFPGHTCVPLSFYISTKLAPKGAKSFWSSVEGATEEEKFNKFLDECTYESNPTLKLRDDLLAQKKSKASLEDDILIYDFFQSWGESKLWGSFSSFLPIYRTVQNNGMWLDALLRVIQKLNPHYVEELKLSYEDFSPNTQPEVTPAARLALLKQTLEKSFSNSFFPLITWNNLYRDSEHEVWQRWGGHAVTLTSIDELDCDASETRLKFTYIDNEDGLEYDGFFYVTGEEALGEIDTQAVNQIHVWTESLKPNRLFTLNGIIASKL